MLSIALGVVLAAGAQDILEGSEIGDATQSMSFQKAGKFAAEKKDPANTAGPAPTVAQGIWTLVGEHLTVTVATCKGPRCGEITSFTAVLSTVGERAMTVLASPGAMLQSGSYYCRNQGCERRAGIEVLAHAARPTAVKKTLDTLIDVNKQRDTTVVWLGQRLAEKQRASQVTYCGRDEAFARKAADEVLRDLSDLGWFRRLDPVRSNDATCAWDVRVALADDVVPHGPDRK